jgi:uncharacterized membrane protein
MTIGEVIDHVGTGVDVVGVGIVVVGAAAAVLPVLLRLVSGATGPNDYREARQGLGRAILLGLEFLVAGDIIRTVAVAPTFTSVGVLAVIVLVRTLLSFSLEVELEGRWPWQRDVTARHNDERTTTSELRSPGNDGSCLACRTAQSCSIATDHAEAGQRGAEKLTGRAEAAPRPGDMEPWLPHRRAKSSTARQAGITYVSSPMSTSIRRPSCHVPSGPRSYFRITPTRRKPTFS